MSNKFLFIFLSILITSSLVIAAQTPTKYAFNLLVEEANASTTSGNVTNFTQLLDTPSTYVGGSGQCVKINLGETALVFGTCGNGTGGGFTTDQNSELNTTGSPSFKNLTLDRLRISTSFLDFELWKDGVYNYIESYQNNLKLRTNRSSDKVYISPNNIDVGVFDDTEIDFIVPLTITGGNLSVYDSSLTATDSYRAGFGRNSAESLEIRSGDDDAKIIYKQDSDEGSDHDLIFDTEGGQNHSLFEWIFRINGLNKFRVTNESIISTLPIYENTNERVCTSENGFCNQSTGGNPFNQSLNTTDNVTFNSLNSSSAYVGNLYFGDDRGYFNYTSINRPLIDDGVGVSVNVCSSGCDYTTIQSAVYDVPLILRGEYVINIEDGIYNEDVYLAPVIVSGSASTQGSVQRFKIKGNSSNINGVKVKSFQIGSGVGAVSTVISYLQVYGVDPKTNEGASISVYGSQAFIHNINFTSNVDSAVMGYGSPYISLTASNFNGSQNQALRMKEGGIGKLGDDSSNPNTGSVSLYLSKGSRSKVIVADDNQISYPSTPFLCEDKGSIFIFNDLLYCVEGVDTSLFNISGNLTADYYFGDGSLLTNLPSNGFTTDQNAELNTTGGPTFVNGTFQDLFLGNLRITNVSSNNLWEGLLNIRTGVSVNNNLMMNLEHDEQTHLWIQEGGPGQASGIVRSFIIVNEVAQILNSTNITDCGVWQDNLSIPSNKQVDCNTSTTGADLIVGDDILVVGDVIVSDHDGEYHNLNRVLELLDELYKDTVMTGINNSLMGLNLTINESGGESIVINIDEMEIDLERNSDNVSLLPGTNQSPNFNHIYYTNPSNPVLSVSTIPQDFVPDVGQVIIGDNYVYGSLIGAASGKDFIRGVYHRFFDDGATYFSGFNPNVSSNFINISNGKMDVLLNTFNITSEFSSEEQYTHILDNGTFKLHNSINEIVNYNSGETISNNKYFNVVCGVALTSEGEGRMNCVVQDMPPSEFTKVIDAETTINNLHFFPQNDFLKKIYVPVARIVIQRSGGVNTIQTLSSGDLYLDLRGTINSGGAPPTPGITRHSDLSNLEWADAGHTFLNTGKEVNIGSYNLTSTGNATFDNLFANINYSYILNAPWREETNNTFNGDVIVNGDINATGEVNITEGINFQNGCSITPIGVSILMSCD